MRWHFYFMFNSINRNINFPQLEEEIIQFWREHNIFAASVEKSAPRGNYVFYEGPPTANGRPGIHHVSARAFKDLFPRYKTMRGFRVQRRGGWDTHGLPVEVEIEKEIGSTGKQDIEKFGIAEFNKLCRESVFRYIQEWNKLTERIGFWVDLDNAYITYDNSYIETCWWILKSLWERNLLYQDYKTTMHCPRCNTSLADHEVSQGMKDEVDDPSVWPKFPAHPSALLEASLLTPEEVTKKVSFLAWTTTPWTLGANTALAVRGDAEYGLFEAPAARGQEEGETELYILAVALAADVFGEDEYKLLRTFSGGALVGLTYGQILKGYVPENEDLSRAFSVVSDDFVSIEDGTGIVHIAPAYGDLEVGRKHGLPTLFSVDRTGKVYPEVKAPDAPETVGPYANTYFKDADKQITRDLKKRGLMYRSERVKHAYPFCWRDDSPLLFYAKTSWYIRTTAVKGKLLENNLKINWVPENIKTGRFGKWLENNIDWAISRERYWGAPLPIWISEDGEDKICVASVAELEELTGRRLESLDLHRPYIDDITFQKNGQTYRRVPDTVDVWFESGAMPYAQWHYPFEHAELLPAHFPADYICEAMDQTRGWFYSLHALATLLTARADPSQGIPAGPLAHLFPETSAFKTCIVLGFINDAKGQKMSKTRGNAVDPWSVLNEQGADALRWYLYTSSPPDANKNFNRAHVSEVVKDFLLTLWNVYGFFVLYANLDEPDLRTPLPHSERPEIDRWLVAKLNRLIETVTRGLDDYDVTSAARTLNEFVGRDLSNWYVRRNRRRFWKSGNDADKRAAYLTLYEALVTVSKLGAPMIPFMTEAIYQNLVRSVTPDAPSSVHLSDWPTADASLTDERLLADMDLLLKIIELGRAARANASVKVRQPLPEILVRVNTEMELAALRRFEELIKEELNAKQVTHLDFDTHFVSYSLRPNLPVVGKLLGGKTPEFIKALNTIDPRQVAINVRRGEKTPVRLGDDTVEFAPEAFLVDVKSPEGYAAVEEGSYLVALNTNLTPELIMEGQARDVVRHVQNARKQAGMDVSDYIVLGLDASDTLLAAVRDHEKFIKSEGLIESLEYNRLSRAEHTEEVDIGGTRLAITLRRA
jgi:isoleucyl-tRNA synthetase